MINIIIDQYNIDSKLFYDISSYKFKHIKVFYKNSNITNSKHSEHISKIKFKKNDYYIRCNNDFSITQSFEEKILNNKSKIIVFNKMSKSNNDIYHYFPDKMFYKYGYDSVYHNRLLYNDISVFLFRFENSDELKKFIGFDIYFIVKKIYDTDKNNFKYVQDCISCCSPLVLFDLNISKLEEFYKIINKIINKEDDYMTSSLCNYWLYLIAQCIGFKISRSNFNQLSSKIKCNIPENYFLYLLSCHDLDYDKKKIYFLYYKRYFRYKCWIIKKIIITQLKTTDMFSYKSVTWFYHLFLFILMSPFILLNWILFPFKLLYKRFNKCKK